jgi:TRAP-type C4-dicarboxylate transport system substrate-binding protein
MRRSRLLLICLLAVSMVFTSLAGVAFAGKVYKWRMASLYPRGTEFGKVYQIFCDNVKAMSDGRIKISMVYDGEGVPATEVLAATKSGLIEMGAPYMALHAGELPAGVVELGLPGGPSEFLGLVALFNESGWADTLKMAYADYGVVWIAPYYQPATYMLTQKPIKSLAELKGLKIRAVGAYGKAMKKLGMSPVTMAFAETYTSLATGVIDATCGSNLIDFKDGKWYEPAKYLFPLKLTGAQVAPIIINKAAWKKLSPDLKQILTTAGNWCGVDMAVKAMTWEKAALAQMKKGGMKWGPALSEADIKGWQAAGMAIWPEYKKAGKWSQKLLEQQAAFMKKYGVK